MTTINMQFEISPEHEPYVEASARLRGLSRTRLITRLLNTIFTDQMILSVLDDGDQLNPRPAPGPAVGRAMPPADKVFDSVAYAPVRRRYNPTKSEMQADLRQAVLNTPRSADRRQRISSGMARMGIVERKKALLKRAAECRFCPSDLGDTGEQNKWQSALRELVEAGLLHKCPPEERTRRVYYELSPTTVAVVPTTALPSPALSSAGDHEPAPPEDVRGTMMQGGFA